MSVSWLLVTYLIWILASKFVSQTTNLSRLCGFLTRVSSSHFILWWASWSLSRYHHNCSTFCFIVSQLDATHTQAISRFLESASLSRRFLCWWFPVLRRITLLHLIPLNKSKRSTVHSKTSIQWNNFWFCRTVTHWRLLLALLPYGNKCWTNKNTSDSSANCFGVLKVGSKIWVLEKNPIDTAVLNYTHSCFFSSNFLIDGSPYKELNFVQLLSFDVSINNVSQPNFPLSFHIVWSSDPDIYQLLQQKFVLRTFCHHTSIMVSFGLHSRWVHPQDVVKKWCWFSKIDMFHKFVQHRNIILLSSKHFDIMQNIDKNDHSI